MIFLFYYQHLQGWVMALEAGREGQGAEDVSGRTEMSAALARAAGPCSFPLQALGLASVGPSPLWPGSQVGTRRAHSSRNLLSEAFSYSTDMLSVAFVSWLNREHVAVSDSKFFSRKNLRKTIAQYKQVPHIEISLEAN